MQRRLFVKAAAAGSAAAALAAPAMVRGQAQVRWRLASSWPKNLDTIYSAADVVSKRVAAATGGKFEIRVFAPGEIVPALQVADAVQQGTVECAHTASVFFFGKDPTFALDGQIPCGMNSRQMTAWMYDGGGLALLREFYREYNIVNFPCGNTGAQMGGWFRKEIKTLDDIKGLKFRIGGFGGVLLDRLGAGRSKRGGRYLHVARERHDRRGRVHRSLRRRTARALQNRKVLLLPELLGRVRSDHDVRECEVLGKPVEGVSGDFRGGPAQRRTSICRRSTTPVTQPPSNASSQAARSCAHFRDRCPKPCGRRPTSCSRRSLQKMRSGKRSTRAMPSSATTESCGFASPRAASIASWRQSSARIHRTD